MFDVGGTRPVLHCRRFERVAERVEPALQWRRAHDPLAAPERTSPSILTGADCTVDTTVRYDGAEPSTGGTDMKGGPSIKHLDDVPIEEMLRWEFADGLTKSIWTAKS